jgi:archaellum biogenesis ATPase FlaH
VGLLGARRTGFKYITQRINVGVVPIHQRILYYCVLNATKNTIENMETIQYTSEEEPKRGAHIGLVLYLSLKNLISKLNNK